MRIRIKFRKYGVMRFIGHGLSCYFQKAMRRAKYDIGLFREIFPAPDHVLCGSSWCRHHQ